MKQIIQSIKTFFYRDCVFGHLPFTEYTEKSLSGAMLESLAFNEAIYLQMMERFENWQGLLIYERRINLYHKQLRFWYNHVLKHKINICIFMTIPHFGYDYVIYSLCKKLGIKTLIPQRIPVVRGMEPHLYVFENINEHIKDLKDKFNFYATNNDKIELNKDFKCYLSFKK